MPPNPAEFDAKFEGLERLTDARLLAMEKVLDRVVDAVDKLTDQNAVIAVIATRVGHLEEGHNSHKTAVNAALVSHDKRIKRVETSSARNAWRLDGAKATLMAFGSAIVAIATVVLDHLDKIAALFGG